jgi:hypothetical protein
MDDSIRVMVERGKKKRVVACAFDWPGWDRSARSEEDALRVLAAYRPRYAKVAALAGLADDFSASGDLSVVERVSSQSMTFILRIVPSPASQCRSRDNIW